MPWRPHGSTVRWMSAPSGLANVTDEFAKVPLRWRPRGPDGRSAGSLSQYVREYLVRNGGSCTREQLLEAIRSEPNRAARLERGQGLSQLLQNLKYGGFVTLVGDSVIATPRTMSRTLIR